MPRQFCMESMHQLEIIIVLFAVVLALTTLSTWGRLISRPGVTFVRIFVRSSSLAVWLALAATSIVAWLAHAVIRRWTG